jgi:hypothetical protein
MMINFKINYRVELAPTLTGHWYFVYEEDKFLGTFPSSTTILNAYPQSQYLTKWIAEKGYNEATQIRDEKGVSGTKIHKACDLLESKVTLNKTDYSLEEWWKISTFVAWYKETLPELIATEIPIYSKKGKYAGRLDRIYKLPIGNIILDFKSSSALHPHFPLQFASYAQAIEENTDIKITETAALLLGANNKKGYRFEEYPDWKEHYKVFKHVKATWQYDYFDSKKNLKEPPVLLLPDELKL